MLLYTTNFEFVCVHFIISHFFLSIKSGKTTQQHISRIENDEVCPTVDTLLKLAKALDVSITTLTEEELLVVEEKCIFEMVKKLELLSMDSKMKVSGYIDCLYQDEMKKFRIKRSKQT